jgi:hypothetical protein
MGQAITSDVNKHAPIGPGTLIVTPFGHLGRVERAGQVGAARGWFVASPTGDPGSTTPMPSFAQSVRPAVVGVTVCPKPIGVCYCGLAHLSTVELGWVTH